VPAPDPIDIPASAPVDIPAPAPIDVPAPAPDPIDVPAPDPIDVPAPAPVDVPAPEPIDIPAPDLGAPEDVTIDVPEAPVETPAPETVVGPDLVDMPADEVAPDESLPFETDPLAETPVDVPDELAAPEESLPFESDPVTDPLADTPADVPFDESLPDEGLVPSDEEPLAPEDEGLPAGDGLTPDEGMGDGLPTEETPSDQTPTEETPTEEAPPEQEQFTPNGCGSSGVDVPEAYFTDACNAHDACYANQGGKQACDDQFLRDMQAACDQQTGVDNAICNQLAPIYREGVRIGGGPSYCGEAFCPEPLPEGQKEPVSYCGGGSFYDGIGGGAKGCMAPDTGQVAWQVEGGVGAGYKVEAGRMSMPKPEVGVVAEGKLSRTLGEGSVTAGGGAEVNYNYETGDVSGKLQGELGAKTGIVDGSLKGSLTGDESGTKAELTGDLKVWSVPVAGGSISRTCDSAGACGPIQWRLNLGTMQWGNAPLADLTVGTGGGGDKTNEGGVETTAQGKLSVRAGGRADGNSLINSIRSFFGGGNPT
jgi:hypothetical protein